MASDRRRLRVGVAGDGLERNGLTPLRFALTTLSRDCVDLFTGAAARGEPFAEPALRAYLSALDDTHRFFAVLLAETSAHFAHADRLSCLLDAGLGQDAGARHALKIIVAAHALPVHRELERRLVELERVPVIGQEAQDERRVVRAWYEGMRRDVERVVVADARLVCEGIREVPSLASLTHLVCPPLNAWAEYLIRVRVAEDGGLMPRAERRRALETVLSGVRSMGWSWTGGESTTASLEAALRVPDPILPDFDPIILDASWIFGQSVPGLETRLEEEALLEWSEVFGVDAGPEIFAWPSDPLLHKVDP